MTNLNYTITDISFTARQEVVNDSYDEQGNAVGTTTRTTKLVMHASYKYRGLTLSDEYGVVNNDMQDLSIVTISPEGLLNSVKNNPLIDTLKTKEGIVAEAKKLIEAKIASDAMNADERNHIDLTLAEVRAINVPGESSHSMADVLAEINK